MRPLPLPNADDLALAAQLSDAGLDLVPAAVAGMVLVALIAAFVISARRRRETDREHAEYADEDGAADRRKVHA